MNLTMTLQVQAVCNKLNLFIDDQQQLAETKTGPRYGFVIFSNFDEADVLRGIMLHKDLTSKWVLVGGFPQNILIFKVY